MSPTQEPIGDLTKRLFEQEAASEDTARMQERRRKVVAQMEQLLHQEARRRTRRKVLWGGLTSLALAASIALSVMRWRSVHPSAATSVASASSVGLGSGSYVLYRDGQALGATSVLAANDELRVVGAGHADLRLTQGTRLQVAERTIVRMASEPAPRSVRLVQGHIDVSVPKLAAGDSFSIEARDLRVTVHGTRFSVDVAESESQKVSVVVSEGKVSIERGAERLAMLEAGQSWSSQPDHELGAEPQKQEAIAPASAKPQVPVASSKPSQVVSSAQSSEPKSTLAEENRLFQAAVGAARSGRDAEAMKLFDKLISSYPQSPLLEQARVERGRCAVRLQQ